jgi:hypothetical protein
MCVQVFVFFPDAAKVGVKDIKVSKSQHLANTLAARLFVCFQPSHLLLHVYGVKGKAKTKLKELYVFVQANTPAFCS